MLMFNSLLRYFMLTYLSLTTGCSMVVFRAYEEDAADINVVAYTLSMIVLVYCLVMIVPITLWIFKNKSKLRQQNFRQKFGTLYTPCDTFKGNGPLIFIAIFCVRRFMIAITVGSLV